MVVAFQGLLWPCKVVYRELCGLCLPKRNHHTVVCGSNGGEDGPLRSVGAWGLFVVPGAVLVALCCN